MDNFWGTLPDWIVGVGTFGLAIVTVVGLSLERNEKRRLQAQLAEQSDRELRYRLEDAERMLEEDHRAQAERIVVWSEVMTHDDINLFDDIGQNLDDAEAAIIRNDSSLPITNVWIYWCSVGGSGELASRLVQTVPPRSERSYQRPWSLIQNPTLPVELVFTDAQGVTWRRTRDGKVHELGEENAATGGRPRHTELPDRPGPNETDRAGSRCSLGLS